MSDFLIAYGSQTGQAETIAKSLKERAELLGLKPRIFALDENEKQFNLNEEKLCAIVVSSTGDGDAPDNAARFVRRINRRTLADDFMKGLDYAILGLGDSNYSSYQTIPRKIDKQLTALGGSRLFERGEADDQVGLELAVEPWIEQLFKVLAERFGISEDKLNAVTEAPQVKLNKVKTEEEKKELLSKRKADEEEDEEGVGGVSGVEMLIPDHYDYPEVSLLKGSEALSNDENLRVPIAPQPFLVSSVSHKKLSPETKLEWQNSCKMPGVVTKPLDALVVAAEFVTDPFSKKQIKTKRMITVDFGENAKELQYEPGDAIYFCVPNPAAEVNFILKRCGVLPIADQLCELSIDKKTEKINAQIPGHVHKESTLRHMFTTCLDIRRAPGRPLIRVLAESTTDAAEKRRLLELCSAQGMKDFTEFVRQAGLSLADVLFAFPNVKPPVDRLIELLPRLIPRPYSMSSYEPRRARLIYSEMEFPVAEGRRHARKGLATDWLNSLRVGDTVQVLGKEPARFRLPPLGQPKETAGNLPLLMIGPGTGVSVFLSFLHLLAKIKRETPENFADVPRILFFGCRDVSVDGIYMNELREFVNQGILTDLIINESEQKKERVQDGLRKNLDKVLPFLTPSTEAKIFICGDAKGMSKDVWQCFADIVAADQKLTDLEAKKKLMELKKSDQYIEDVWG